MRARELIKTNGLIAIVTFKRRPDLTFLISDLARSSSKTSDERLRVARVLLRQKASQPLTCAVTWTQVIIRLQILASSLTLGVPSVG